jgi:hypothetical protein
MKLQKEKLMQLLRDVGCTLVFLFPLLLFYMFANEQRWPFVFWLYFVATAAVGVVFFLYNRGFTHTRVSRNELPATWSDAQKDAFFDEARARFVKSKPLFYLFIALVLVFLYDMIQLFLWDALCDMLPFLKEIS